MTRNRPAGEPPTHTLAEGDIRELLGYLNYSNGTPDAQFQRGLNELYGQLSGDHPQQQIMQLLLEHLERAEGGTSAFADVSQARAVIPLALEECVAAYRAHHRDLLFHLPERDFEHPLLLARMVEGVLAQGPPWSETERVLSGAVQHLNDFVGFRPLAVLENNRKMQPYAHEAFRPVPLFIREAGIAHGPYRDVIGRALKLFKEMPAEIQHDAHFYLEHADEIALDVRAYDHLHPVNKRTNYIFGEWDPHVIDSKGFYRRFVLRKMILDALVDWVEQQTYASRDERLFDAAAVLCGTILMASAVSGSGPDTHDSTTSLTTLLPEIARRRDLFYAQLLQQARGQRATRLKREAERTQQPFGHVRQHLNIQLSELGARQVNDRFLTQFFARLGYPEASRQQAVRIPCPASRFESEIAWRLTSAERCVERSDPQQALQLLQEVRDRLHRGIDCGALVDPWNILGFQGQFPLFHSREDSVPDQRVEVLLQFMAQFFEAAARAMCEASASGDAATAQSVSELFESVAEWWDRFATTTISDLPQVHGNEAWASARSVADAVSKWRTAGEATGDISFWRGHVDRFESPQAYGRVVEALLNKGDHIGANALLMQWLSQADDVGLSSGSYSFGALLWQWVQRVTRESDTPSRRAEDTKTTEAKTTDIKTTFRRLFDFLEANAAEYWSVPELTNGGTSGASQTEFPADDEEQLWDEDAWSTDDESDLFEAAYEGVVYRDSAEDGHAGDMLDGEFIPRDTEIEAAGRELEPRLDFLNTVAGLWQSAAEKLGSRRIRLYAEDREMVLAWIRQVRAFRRGFSVLLSEVADYSIPPPTGNPDSNLEFDIQMQARYYLLHKTVTVAAEFRTAEWYLRSLLDDAGYQDAKVPANSRKIANLIRHVLRGDVVGIRRQLPGVLKLLAKQPLLYVSLEKGGAPRRFLAARSVQSLLTFLFERLPRLGLLTETRQLLWTAYRMERSSQLRGTATTEFDRLLHTALVNSVKSALISTQHWSLSRLMQPEHTETPHRRRPYAPVPRKRRLFWSSRRETTPRPRRGRPSPRRKTTRSEPAMTGRTNPARRKGPPHTQPPRRGQRRTLLSPGVAFPAGMLAGREAARHHTRPSRQTVVQPASLQSITENRTRSEVVLGVVQYLVERYQTVWLKHSRSVRLSPVELLQEKSRWTRVKQFIERYGDDLLHAPMLMLSNIRAILHQGVDQFLDFLAEEHNPLQPLPLLEDIEAGHINRREACKLLELIYECILDKLDRFIEYNTTTTQSDYGSLFYCLLDFLRLEAGYDRDAWNIRPYQMAHEVIAEVGSSDLPEQWEQMIEHRTRDRAENHLKRLRRLQDKYSVRLPSVLDHLNERFVKTMVVDRMRALIGPALRESRNEQPNPQAIEQLRSEIDRYLESTAGSAIEVPEWLVRLEREIERAEEETPPSPNEETATPFTEQPFVPLRPRQLTHRLSGFSRQIRSPRPRPGGA